MLYILATDGLDVTTEIMTASQAQQVDTGKVLIYLKPDKNDGSQFGNDAFNREVNFTMTASTTRSKRAHINIERNQKESIHLWDKRAIKCQLQIVLPNSFSNDDDNQQFLVSNNSDKRVHSHPGCVICL